VRGGCRRPARHRHHLDHELVVLADDEADREGQQVVDQRRRRVDPGLDLVGRLVRLGNAVRGVDV
jgi:hypothetical protein